MNYVSTYLRKPQTIEAGQVLPVEDGDDMPNRLSIAGLSGWMMAHDFHAFKVVECGDGLGLQVRTIDGNDAVVKPGWFLARGVLGEFYPIAADVMSRLFEKEG